MKGVRPLQNYEIEKVCQCFEGKYEVRNRSLFLLGVSVGGRISEMLALKIEDVWQNNKPVSDLLFRKNTVKGKKHARAVPVNIDGRQAITDLIRWYQSWKTFRKSMPLFVSREGENMPLGRRAADRILNSAFTKAGLNGKLGTHTLRKSYAQRLYGITGDIYAVKEMLGHQSLNTTQKYLGVDYSSVRQASELMAIGSKQAERTKPLYKANDHELLVEMARRGYDITELHSHKP